MRVFRWWRHKESAHRCGWHQRCSRAARATGPRSTCTRQLLPFVDIVLLRDFAERGMPWHAFPQNNLQLIQWHAMLSRYGIIMWELATRRSPWFEFDHLSYVRTPRASA
jgi:hypothetical protein